MEGCALVDRRLLCPGRGGAGARDLCGRGSRAGDDSAIIAALVLFFVAIFAGVPVGFVLLLAAAVVSLEHRRGARWSCCRKRMVNGTGNFILLAVPFFILAGLIMERGGDQRAPDPLHPERASAIRAAGCSRSP